MKAIYVIFCVQHLCIVWTGSSNEQGRHLRYSLTAHDGDKGSPSSGRQRYRRFTDYTESDIEYWINRHNQHRGEVDPPASDMKFMTWDDDLATMAQTWVDYCHWEHGDPDIQHSYEHTGQNMWVFGPSSLEERPTVSDAVDAWYDERYDYDYETNSCVPGRVCGHYTQTLCKAVQYIQSFAQSNGIPTAAAPSGRDSHPPVYLPASSRKESIHTSYKQTCEAEGDQYVGLTLFKNLWRECVPHIKILTPITDICPKCEHFRQKVSHARTEVEKVEAVTECSRRLFGINNEGTSKQVNYLLDESQTICIDGTKSHGPNTVISMLHHYLSKYSVG